MEWSGYPLDCYDYKSTCGVKNRIILGAVGPNFPMDMTWSCLASNNQKKNISQAQGVRLLVIEPVHRGSSSILKITFLGHPLDVNMTTKKSNFWRLKCSHLQVILKEKLHWNGLPRHAQPPLAAKPPNPGEHPISWETKWSRFWLFQQIWVPSNSE